jgi:hypothetical protein
MPKRLKRQRDPIQLGKLVATSRLGKSGTHRNWEQVWPCRHTPAPSTRGAED